MTQEIGEGAPPSSEIVAKTEGSLYVNADYFVMIMLKFNETSLPLRGCFHFHFNTVRLSRMEFGKARESKGVLSMMESWQC